ncbi:hypothetical protein BDY21DRAFT_386257 [Lineolata rhizophorae]|uniref:Pyruvate dehydrogenase protein x component n=1 Tax=Lineolata rhizophorae TaxID=578093 RepID=A0A6A6NZA5_9PEZI|nr:hypothetical protein BDY21DRAFT_386257 [Lineolata rhizophorae]
MGFGCMKGSVFWMSRRRLSAVLPTGMAVIRRMTFCGCDTSQPAMTTRPKALANSVHAIHLGTGRPWRPASSCVVTAAAKPARNTAELAAALAAHNFAMPAMSPTMTEGNISKWKLKEGDSFTAGDVLLEIETDKAQMDVEAQDDGVLAKIMQGDGSKSVQVGTRIAVMADPDDDLSSLEIPPEDSAPESKKAEEKPSKPAPSAEPGVPKTESSKAQSTGANKPEGKPRDQKYPLYPSVQHLLNEKGISDEEASKIPATGPNGRLLKGDVLAYLGSIQSDYPKKQAQRIEKLSHLDLSNIKAAPPKTSEAKKPAPATRPEPPPPPPETQVTVHISLTEVLRCQKRIRDSLGIDLPLSAFVARAVELANEDLPRSKLAKPTADELFNAVLGLNKVKASRGHFSPQIMALGPPLTPVSSARKTAAKPDPYDILTGKASSKGAKRTPVAFEGAGVSASHNTFSITVPKGDEKRAKVFLERVKTVLEAEPGRLVL